MHDQLAPEQSTEQSVSLSHTNRCTYTHLVCIGKVIPVVPYTDKAAMKVEEHVTYDDDTCSQHEQIDVIDDGR